MRIFSSLLVLVTSLLLPLFFMGCVSTLNDFSDVVSLDDDDDDALVLSKVRFGAVPYRHQGEAHKVPWVACEAQESKRFFLLAIANTPEAKTPMTICKSGVVQAFMVSGYAVVAFHLPGYGEATGKKDFGGDHSIAAISTIVRSLSVKYKGEFDDYGLWGYGVASVPVLFFGKQVSDEPTLVIGGGIYDMEAVTNSSNHQLLKKTMATLVKAKGEMALEKRSISWDPSGLPKRILMYHADKDQVFPKGGAQAFRDSLATQGYSVGLSVLPGVGHVFSEKLHRSALKKLLREQVRVDQDRDRD